MNKRKKCCEMNKRKGWFLSLLFLGTSWVQAQVSSKTQQI